MSVHPLSRVVIHVGWVSSKGDVDKDGLLRACSKEVQQSFEKEVIQGCTSGSTSKMSIYKLYRILKKSLEVAVDNEGDGVDGQIISANGLL